MKLNHIIIGAGRSGTTSLVAYLQQHPKINFSTIKEVTYFSVKDHFKRGETFLHSFFKENEGKINATSDTYLLMDKNAPQRIFDYHPSIKITVILREPAARTFSNYQYSLNQGYIDKKTSFLDSQQLEEKVLAIEDIIEQNNHCNFYGSLYHLHLTNWLKFFNKEQFFICTTNQLKNNPQQLMDNYFQFLGLDKIEIQELSAQNKAAGVKNKTLNQFLVNRDHWLRKLISKPLQISFLRNIVLNSNVVDAIKNKNKEEMTYEPMTEKEAIFCKTYFSEDLKKLENEFGIRFN